MARRKMREQFPYLLKYSPYQNVKAGTKYPAIMFNTGDSDTRVDPLHARKMTALMQAETGSDRPILLHYELKAGTARECRSRNWWRTPPMSWRFSGMKPEASEPRR